MGAAKVEPSRCLESPTLATPASSRQASPGQEGDRAAWGNCSLGDRLLADLVQQAELEAADGPGEPEGAHDPAHVACLRVHESQKDCALSDYPAEILLKGQESWSSVRACHTRWLTRNNARAALSNALTNSRQIQHWTDDLIRRISQHRNPRWRGAGRLVQVALEAGLTFELAWLEYPATRGRERRLKNQGSAYRRCPLCRGTGGPSTQPPQSPPSKPPWSPIPDLLEGGNPL